MSIDERQQQTAINVQEKANLIWAIADKLVGVYKPHEYGNVILPMCVIKRFEDTLAPTREKVLETNKELEEKKIEMKRGFLERAAGQKFYALSHGAGMRLRHQCPDHHVSVCRRLWHQETRFGADGFNRL